MGEEAGAPLVRHPEVRLVTFAGSGTVGREVAITCAAEHKRMALGMGGKNVLVVMDDGDLDLALDAVVRGAFATTGQRPTSIGRLILHRAIAREFSEQLVARASALRLGDGLLPTSEMGPLVNEVRLKRAHAYARLGVKEGARLLCGGEAFRDGDCKRGFFYLPTVLGEVRPTMRIAQEEVLGPAVCLLTVRDLQGAIGAVHGMRPSCSVSLFSRDVQRALLAVRDLHVGHIAINALAAEVPGAAGAPGSAGDGGWGGGAHRMDRFTGWKTVALGIGRTGPGHPGD